jgi:hypothetical protein
MSWQRIWHIVIISGVSPGPAGRKCPFFTPGPEFSYRRLALVYNIAVTVSSYPSHGCLIVVMIAGWYPEFSHKNIHSEEEQYTLRGLIPVIHRQKPRTPHFHAPPAAP